MIQTKLLIPAWTGLELSQGKESNWLMDGDPHPQTKQGPRWPK